MKPRRCGCGTAVRGEYADETCNECLCAIARAERLEVRSAPGSQVLSTLWSGGRFAGVGVASDHSDGSVYLSAVLSLAPWVVDRARHSLPAAVR